MQAVGVVLIILAVLIIIKWNYDPVYAKFKLIYLISNKDGYPDENKIKVWGVFFLTSYAMLWLLWHDDMTEGYLFSYVSIWAAVGSYALKKRVEAAKENIAPPIRHNEPEKETL